MHYGEPKRQLETQVDELQSALVHFLIHSDHVSAAYSRFGSLPSLGQYSRFTSNNLSPPSLPAGYPIRS